MPASELLFWLAVAFVTVANLYFAPRIKSDRVAMQWGWDGKPTWHAPKWFALWGMVGFMLALRLFIWLAMIYVPQYVNLPVIGVAGVGIILAAAQVFILWKAARAG